jgi:hypothetical protein
MQYWFMHTRGPSGSRGQQTVSRMLELCKTACTRDSALLYWLLDDLLRENGAACKSPRMKDNSWHKLALAYPPLIFSVGELNPELLNSNDFAFQWIGTKSKRSSPTGGIAGNRQVIERWFLQANSRFAAVIEQTQNKLSFWIWRWRLRVFIQDR